MTFGGRTLWALWRLVFTTVRISIGVAGFMRSLTQAPIAAGGCSARGRANEVKGVPGILFRIIAGVAGAGRLPSAEGRHPDLKESKTTLLVASSVTHAASLYTLGIFEPFSQWP